MRAFIALELPLEIKSWLSQELQNKLKSTHADVKWVEAENLHLTLKFLGEIDNEKVQKIKQILEEIGSQTKSFQVQLSHIGAFPKITSPRVIWVGIENDQAIKEIVQLLEKRISSLGIPEEKKEFKSHITLGRVRSSKNQDKLIAELKNLSSQDFQREFYFDRIVLFESILTPQGPIYKPHLEITLKTI